MKLTITKFFEDLGAPLTNQQWSWGAVRDDGTVFLRVFDDEVTSNDTGTYALLISPEHRESHHGMLERMQQLERVRAGALCYLIVLTAVEAMSRPRKILYFNHHELLIAGNIVERDGKTLIEIIGRTTPMAVRAQRSNV